MAQVAAQLEVVRHAMREAPKDHKIIAFLPTVRAPGPPAGRARLPALVLFKSRFQIAISKRFFEIVFDSSNRTPALALFTLSNRTRGVLLSGRGWHLTCRGTWARVTIDQFRHLALRTFYGHKQTALRGGFRPGQAAQTAFAADLFNDARGPRRAPSHCRFVLTSSTSYQIS